MNFCGCDDSFLCFNFQFTLIFIQNRIDRSALHGDLKEVLKRFAYEVYDDESTSPNYDDVERLINEKIGQYQVPFFTWLTDEERQVGIDETMMELQAQIEHLNLSQNQYTAENNYGGDKQFTSSSTNTAGSSSTKKPGKKCCFFGRKKK